MKKNRFIKFFCCVVIYSLFISYHDNSYSIPTSFLKTKTGNMKDTEWERLESPSFSIYYPKEASNIGKYSLFSAEVSYPYLSLLLGVKLKNDPTQNLQSQKERVLISKFEKVPFILGNVDDGAGFANPVTLSIEAQILHSRTASFFQHELVHRLMYEHNDFHIGPAGWIFSLAMFPSWWIEGLAEHLTESVGKELTDNITRYMAINDYWPSWDRMHALYNADGDTNTRGYVASGRFLRWIFLNAKEKDLYKIHEQISKKSIIPPFYNASDSWLNKNLGKNGESLFEDFKTDQKKYWEQYLNNLPALVDEKRLVHNGQKHDYPNYNFENYSIYSKMVSDLSPYNSALYLKNFSNNSDTRVPINTDGSQYFDISAIKDGTILTSNLKKFANGKMGHELISFSFKGDLHLISNENVFNKKQIHFTPEKNQLITDQILYLGNDNFAILASENGNQKIYIINIINNNIKFLKQYPFPASIKLIKNQQEKSSRCISLMINNDLNGTSIEKICEDGTNLEILPANLFHLKDAFILKEGTIRILSSWHKIMSLLDYTPQKEIKPIAAFPDWIESISPFSNESDKYVTAWVYKKGKFYLQKIDIEKAHENFKNWQKIQDKNSLFLSFPKFESYRPPYLEIYEQQKQFLLEDDLIPFEKNLSTELPKKVEILNSPINSSEQNETKQVTQLPASYRSQFLFAYPYAIPDFLGGPSIGLFAIPLSDEMERYRVQIFGGYNFFLNAPSGAVTYINNRFLDNFSLSLFASPFFNGYYDMYNQNQNQKVRYYNYLQQSGLSVTAGWNFRLFSSSLQSLFSIYKLTPYSNLTAAPESIGAQDVLMASATGLLTLNAFNTSFYMSAKDKPNGEWLNWSTDISFGGGKYNGLGDSSNSRGNSAGDVDYYNLNSSILSAFNLYKQNLSILGKISTTQGSNTLNIKEIYSPYQSYILGSTTSLNYISYPIIGSGSLFELRSGFWSYLTRGGVSNQKDFSNYNSLTSASVGSSMTVDIKGFQLFPSLSYGWIVGQENNWYILMQLKFMDIL